VNERHYQRTKAVVSGAGGVTGGGRLNSETQFYMCGRAKVTVNKDSQVTNNVDRVNVSFSDR